MRLRPTASKNWCACMDPANDCPAFTSLQMSSALCLQLLPDKEFSECRSASSSGTWCSRSTANILPQRASSTWLIHFPGWEDCLISPIFDLLLFAWRWWKKIHQLARQSWRSPKFCFTSHNPLCRTQREKVGISAFGFVRILANFGTTKMKTTSVAEDR